MMKNVFLLLLPILLLSCGSPNAQENIDNSKSSPNTQEKVVNIKNSPNAQEKVDNTKINWLSLEEAEAMNKKNPKKLIVDMYTHWCGPCKMMERSTFTDAEIIKHINENYYAVKFNAESGESLTFNGKEYKNPQFDANKPQTRRNSPHQFTQAMGIRAYPTLLVFDKNLNVIQRIMGFKRAPQLMPALKALAAK